MHLKPGSYCYTDQYDAYRFFLGVGSFVTSGRSLSNVYLFFNLQINEIWPSVYPSALTYRKVFDSPSSKLIGVMYEGYTLVDE